MKTITVFLSTIFFLTSIVNSQSMVSERLTSEKAFLYYLSIYGFQLSDTPQFRIGDTWIEKYLRKFEKDKYNNAKNDEFLKNDFMSNAKSNLSNKINSLDFNKKYSTFRRGTLREYDFNRQGFPVYIQMFKRLENILFSFDYLYLEFYWFVNDNEFDYFIRMSPEDAKQFIIKRKDPKSGKVNRRISANLIYSVTKVPLIESSSNNYKSGLVGYIYTIYIKPTRNSTEVLGKLLPEEEYYNIINGIKIENGQQIVYYDKSWNVVNDKVDAAYYTLVNYKSGKIKNPIIDYYITGEIQSKGYYKSYNRKEKIRHGLFTWYYKSGKIKEQAKYIDNKRVIE